jgi:hypothetical protein
MTLDDSAHEKAGRGSKARVFISYSRKDLAFADRLEAALEARGFEPLIDRAEIYAFEEWWTRIEKLIASADTVVFLLSPDAIASQVALKEVDFAASLNKRLAPIVCRPVNDQAVPEALAKLNFIVFDDPARFDESADRLAEALATDIGWIRQHTEFGEQARRWTAAKTPNGLLLRSPVLEYAERWIAARPPGAPAPTAETQLFITRSRQGATRRRNALTAAWPSVWPSRLRWPRSPTGSATSRNATRRRPRPSATTPPAISSWRRKPPKAWCSTSPRACATCKA